MSYYNIISGVKKDCSAWLNDESGYLASLELGTFVEEASNYRIALNEMTLNSIISSLNNVSLLISNDNNVNERLCFILTNSLRTCEYHAKAMINIIATLFSEKYLKQLLRAEFGEIENTTNESGLIPNRIKYLSQKPVFHFLEGIDSVNAVKEFLFGILSKSVNFFFVSKELFEPLKAIFELVKQKAENVTLFLSISIICWNLPKEKLFETLSYIGLTYNLHVDGELGDWTSSMRFFSDERVLKTVYGVNLSIIDGKKVNEATCHEIAKKLVDDIVYTTEKPIRIIYIVDKDIKSSHLLIECLYDEMTEANSEFPVRQLDFKEKVKVRNLRECSRMMQAIGNGRLECPADFSFNLILEYNSDFNFYTYGRTVVIKYVQSLDDARSSLYESETSLDCVGIYGFEDKIKELYNILLELNIKHIFSIGGIKKMPAMIVDGRHSLRALTDIIIFQEGRSVED